MSKLLRKGTKTFHVLREFFAGRKIHRFDAEQFGEHVLHTTVSALEKMGLQFDRRTVSVPTRWGADARVTLYWLASESYPLAARLIGKEPRRPRTTQMDDDGARDYRRASGG